MSNRENVSHKSARTLVAGDRISAGTYGPEYTVQAVTVRPGMRAQMVVIDTVEGASLVRSLLSPVKMV